MLLTPVSYIYMFREKKEKYVQRKKEKYVLDKRKVNSTPYVFNLKATKK